MVDKQRAGEVGRNYNISALVKERVLDGEVWKRV